MSSYKGNMPSTKKKQTDTYLVMSLKKQLKEQKVKFNKKEKQLTKIKREIKYTKTKELEVQLNSFVNETIRLKQILDSQSHQMDQYQIKYREYSDLEDKYYQQSNAIEELRKDNLELSEAIRIVEEQNRDFIEMK